MSDESSSNSRLLYLKNQAEAVEHSTDPDRDERGAPGGHRERDGPESGATGDLLGRWLPGFVVRLGGGGRRRGATVAALLGVLGAVVFAVVLIRGDPVTESPPPLPLAGERTSTQPAAAPSARQGTDEPVVVSVVGKVREPGLVTVPAGSRVAVAVEAAGGAQDGVDLASVNLARKLTDGEQIHVGLPVPVAAAAVAAGPGGVRVKVDLNTATAEQLEELPGVGEVTAARILDWRTERGAFTSVEQLREVEGIGDTRLSRLRDHVSVG
ncbi:ComEA family DNA-binding protein [Amycolatopsis palatopharyngis]|uniref:ComEA family DNA-binding protein n=1 Tax=Amycolatopsis palatopharyngis TaxID=187982 RepID=UPI001FE69CDA|nr:helix-hairpin-helix domain-containing protein [Amycolatopsis palatopharyngis]